MGPSNLWLQVLSGLRTIALFHYGPSLQHSCGGNLSSWVTWQDHKVIHWRRHSNKDLRQKSALIPNNNYQWNIDFSHFTSENMGLSTFVSLNKLSYKAVSLLMFLFPTQNYVWWYTLYIYSIYNLLFTHGEEKHVNMYKYMLNNQAQSKRVWMLIQGVILGLRELAQHSSKKKRHLALPPVALQ